MNAHRPRVRPQLPASYTVFAVTGLPEIGAGCDLARLLAVALEAQGERLYDGDIVAIAQKIVSKAEGRAVRLADVTASKRARELAERCGRDPRFVELVLRESRQIRRQRDSLLITEHRLGYINANAGIDLSNVAHEQDGETALLLPADPDASCARIRRDIRRHLQADVGVVITDTAGRAWRLGITGFALGVAGIDAIMDFRGQADRQGRELMVTQVAFADEIAAAASLVQGHGGEGRPVAILRGFSARNETASGRDLIRPADEDLFP